LLVAALALIAAAGAVPCGPPRAKTFAMTATARVYRSPRGDFGCRRGGRRVELAVDDGQEFAEVSRRPIRFNGPFVA
jgi:hypothetical protein